MGYAGQWMEISVYGGDEKAPEGSALHQAFADGERAFTRAGQGKSVVQLVSSLVIIMVLLNTWVPPRFLYAPCIFGGAIVSILAAFFVKQNGAFAMVFSVLPEAGSFAIPFGLVAAINRRAEQEGKVVSTALQMSLLNCCSTVGQQICSTTLAAVEGGMPLTAALPVTFMVAAVAQTIGGTGALFLDDKVDGPDPKEVDDKVVDQVL